MKEHRAVNQEIIPFTIDGKKVSGPYGADLLPIALKAGFRIPTLCYHPAVKSYGACRLCLVEVKRKGRIRLTTSCNYPVLPDLEVITESDRILRNRRTVLELLLARCNKVPNIRKLAAEYGVETTVFKEKGEDCILCGLCARVCDEVIGASAITFMGRGTLKDVQPPFAKSSERCIGCGACAAVCPTKCIRVEREADLTRIARWFAEKKTAFCQKCGAPVGTQEQIDHLAKKFPLDPFILSTCPECRRGYYAAKVASEGHM